MTREVVALASDHAGVELRRQLREALAARGLEALDLGAGRLDLAGLEQTTCAS